MKKTHKNSTENELENVVDNMVDKTINFISITNIIPFQTNANVDEDVTQTPKIIKVLLKRRSFRMNVMKLLTKI